MQLKTYIEELLMGELSHANIAKLLLPHIHQLNPDPNIVTVKPEFISALGKMVGVINTGLTQIYTLLPLAEEELILITNPSTDRYKLTADHAVYAGADSAAMKWIDDSEFAPFPDNVIECLHVIDEQGVGLAVNDSMAVGGVYCPAPNILQVPFAEYEVSLNVLYRASHRKILFKSDRSVPQISGGRGFIIPETEITLAPFLTDALSCFIMAKYYKSIGSIEAIAQGQANYAEFLNIINTVKASQLLHGDFTETNNLADGGWV